jgi:hypothetical protein
VLSLRVPTTPPIQAVLLRSPGNAPGCCHHVDLMTPQQTLGLRLDPCHPRTFRSPTPLTCVLLLTAIVERAGLEPACLALGTRFTVWPLHQFGHLSNSPPTHTAAAAALSLPVGWNARH